MKTTAPLSSSLDRQLALTRSAYTPSAALRERVLARINPGAAPPAAPIGADGQTRLGLRSMASRVFAGATLIGLGFAAGWSANAARTPLPPPLLPTPQLAFELHQAPIAPEPTAPEPAAFDPATPSASPSPRVPRSASPKQVAAQSTTARPDRASTLSSPEASTAAGRRDELLLLQRAERAVRSNNSALALALIGELEENYPRSVLVEERRAIELMAYCRAGATDGAARAQRFERDHPRSVYAERIAELCRASRAPAPASR
jgi:hypothetical protein